MSETLNTILTKSNAELKEFCSPVAWNREIFKDERAFLLFMKERFPKQADAFVAAMERKRQARIEQ